MWEPSLGHLCRRAANPLVPFWYMGTHPLLLVASLIVFLVAFPGDGLQEFIFYYLNGKFHFSALGNAWLLFEIALLGLLLPLRPLRRRGGKRRGCLRQGLIHGSKGFGWVGECVQRGTKGEGCSEGKKRGAPHRGQCVDAVR